MPGALPRVVKESQKEINRKSKHVNEEAGSEFRRRMRSRHVPYQGRKIRMQPVFRIHWIPLDDCGNSVWKPLKTYTVECERCIQ